MSNQLEKIKELIERRAVKSNYEATRKREIHSTRASGYAA